MKLNIWNLPLLAVALAFILAGCAPRTENKSTDTASKHDTPRADYYTCPMHPSVRSDKPGACPICHMSLVRVSAAKESQQTNGDGASVSVSSASSVLANISTAIVESKALTKEISAVGIIDVPEPNTQQISSRFGGRIERLHVSYVGQLIKAGDPVAEMYSPDAIGAQREFLLSLSSSEAGSDQSTMARQARLKLQLLGFTDQQLDQLAKDHNPSTLITIHSPITGTIVKKNVDLQRYVTAGESLYDVADLRTVWLQLDIYDNDISLLRIGQAVEASLDALPSVRVLGRISFISPTLDPSSRTTRVRVSLDNSSGALKPEMYAHATIRVPLSKSPVVPSTAVLSNGKHDIVWVQLEQGHFEPRTVTLGHRSGEFYQILGGLQEGETIAVSGAYLLDSESQLQAATSGGQAK